METLRDRVEKASVRKGLNLTRLAELIGLKLPSLSNALERGLPTYPKIPEIADILEIPADWLRNGGPEPWSNSNSVKENSVSYSVIKEEINEQTRRIDSLEHELTAMAARYIDLAEVAKRKGCDVPQSALDNAHSILESNKPV